MKNSYKKFLSIALSFALVLVTCSAKFPALIVKAQSGTQITVFHTNDMHGRLLDATDKNNVLTQIGADYVASIKKSVPNSLLIDAGDATQGLPFASLSKGADVIRLMNAAGYDGMVLGNHEFDYGKAQLLSNAALAQFPVVSANTLDSGKPLLAGINGNNGEDFIKTVNGIKVGFFGITTQETVYKTNPSNLPGVSFADPITTSQSEVDKLKAEGAKVIVGIMHIGNDSSSSPISDDIAQKVNGINVIIDGHSHTIENKVVNNTLIAQTSCYSANVGRIDINVGADGSVSSTEALISKGAATTTYTADPTVKALADQIYASQAALFNTIVGKTNTALWGGTVNGQSVARLGETNLGDLVADSMVYGAKSQVAGSQYEGLPIVALENGGGVRDSIPVGFINQGQVITVLPFGNILSLKVVTPSLLYKVIENGVSRISKQDPVTGVISGADGRFPQVSGMRFEYDPTKPSLSRVSKIVLLNSDGTDKQVLDPADNKTEIVIASNDYEVGGGDGYTMLGSLKNIGEGSALDVICEQYITKLTQDNGGAFSYPVNQERCKAVSSYNYKPYTATITVTNGVDKDGNPIPVTNQIVHYILDNGSQVQSSTDSKGVLTITNVPSGPHNLYITGDGFVVNAYINDLIGSNADTTIADSVAKYIASLPTDITLANQDAVKQARSSYDSLTASQKALVTNYSVLQAAEATITKDTNDKAAADSVTAMINALPANTTLADKAAVAAARAAYDKLTDAQKALVTNYSNLQTAEATITKLSSQQSSSQSGNSTSGSLPKTGSMVNTASLIDLSVLLMLAGSALLVYKKKETN